MVGTSLPGSAGPGLGPGVGSLPHDSAIRKAFRGAAWGIDMFEILHPRGFHSTTTSASRARMPTTCGCTKQRGLCALLLTDWKENLAECSSLARRRPSIGRRRNACKHRLNYLSHEADRCGDGPRGAGADAGVNTPTANGWPSSSKLSRACCETWFEAPAWPIGVPPHVRRLLNRRAAAGRPLPGRLPHLGGSAPPFAWLRHAGDSGDALRSRC